MQIYDSLKTWKVNDLLNNIQKYVWNNTFGTQIIISTGFTNGFPTLYTTQLHHILSNIKTYFLSKI